MKIPAIFFNKLLLYYSVIFSTIIMIGGIYSARSVQEMIASILFVPVALYLWIAFWQRNKTKATNKENLSEENAFSKENVLAKDKDYFAKLRQ